MRDSISDSGRRWQAERGEPAFEIACRQTDLCASTDRRSGLQRLSISGFLCFASSGSSLLNLCVLRCRVASAGVQIWPVNPQVVGSSPTPGATL